MVGSHIDWDNPPSTRVTAPRPRRLIYALLVLACTSVIVSVLVSAWRGGESPSARGVRTYFIDAMGGSHFLLWGVIGVVVLAALYALVDAARTLIGLLRAGDRSTEDSSTM